MTAKPVLDVDAFLSAYDKLDAVLVKAGFPATSPWWRAEIERFFRARRRRWVVRAGRRAGKSSTLCRIAVCWALAGTWHVPIGDTAVIPFVSLDRDEASGRIRTIDEILTALGVAHETTADEIYLPARHLRFAVKTCSVRAVGFTSVAIFADEMARWTSRDDSANPAAEVMGSLRPTAATIPLGFEVCSSSPWSTVDYHAELFAQGDNDHQITSFAATWTANPTISEADTHAFESDPRVWAREYSAQPSAELSSAFDPAHVESCFRDPPGAEWCAPIAVVDPNSGGADSFTFGLVSWAYPVFEAPTDCLERSITEWSEDDACYVERREYYRVIDTGATGLCVREHGKLRPLPDRPRKEQVVKPEHAPPFLSLSSVQDIPSSFGRGDEIVRSIAGICRRHGVTRVVGDQRESLFLEQAFRAQGLSYHSLAWTSPNKGEAVRRLRRLMSDGSLILPPHEKLRRELLNYQERLGNGTAKYSARGSGHDDHVSLLITACLAESERLLTGSPIARGSRVSRDQSGAVQH